MKLTVEKHVDVKNLAGVQSLKCGIVNKWLEEYEASCYGLECYTGEDGKEDESELQRAYIWLEKAYTNGCNLENEFLCQIELYLNKLNLTSECKNTEVICNSTKIKNLLIKDKSENITCVNRCLKVYDKL